MKKKFIPWIVVGAVVLLLIISFVTSYNGFVSQQQQVKSSWSNIETQLQRRADLIPNLVETVKAYAAQEQEIFTDIANARAKLGGSASPEEQAEANDQLSGALNRLLVVVENYPELKSNANFQQLMDELSGTENRLAIARRDYNDIVAAYNTKIRRIPGAFVARLGGFGEEEFFRATEGAEEPVRVDFGTQE